MKIVQTISFTQTEFTNLMKEFLEKREKPVGTNATFSVLDLVNAKEDEYFAVVCEENVFSKTLTV